ncbi:MAG: hypothetical protein L3J02_00865 [Henriciella sp.]|nr:hypothetical protein [Henriciella sp.]
MAVSSRNTFLTGAGVLALITMGSFAYAGGGMSGGGVMTPGGGTVVPGANTGSHNTSFGGGYQSGPCCGKGPAGHGVIVPGVNVAGPNVMVTGSNVTVNQGSVMTNTPSFLNMNVAGAGISSTFVSGGGGYYAPQGIAPSSIGALNVEGNEERYIETVTEQVPSTEEYCTETVSLRRATRPVQAVCLDDKGMPHPASRVDASQRVSTGYSGELFRCMAGTHMQVTLGSIENGSASFAHGQTFACRKGEALVHKRGGDLSCAPQAPQRDCNERSLLRRHGPGIKIVEAHVEAKTCVPQTRTVMKSVQRQVERTRQAKGQPMVFDGGVGQGVY